VSRLAKAIVFVVLALWGLAAMHCKLEVLPGFDFLKSCCFVGSAPSSPKSCEGDGCCAVENGSYLAEEQSAAAPQPLLIPALLPAVIEAPLLEFSGICFSESKAPPELSRFWQFSYRAARLARAPSLVT
jgi:hypothetical protein